MSLYFLVTIDTEEEREWGGDYLDHSRYTVENISFLEPLQTLFNKHGVIPTYLIDYPVAIDAASAKILQRFQDEFGAEIGMHLHPWVNPPYEGQHTAADSFPCNLPVELQYKKMDVLTRAITEAVGQTPVTYRAGKYGFNPSSIKVLESLGYLVDSSVTPFRERKKSFEPHFGYLPSLEPYFLDYDDVTKTGASKILEVPVTIDFNKHAPEFLRKNYLRLPNIGLKKILEKVFRFDLYWLRPSYATLTQMIELSDSLIERGVSFLNMMFHSNELMPGGSKYNRTQDDVNQYLQRLDQYFGYLNSNHNVQYVRLKDMYGKYKQNGND